MTNGDRIRQMTDEELAGIIMCPYDGTEEMCETYKKMNEAHTCVKCSEAWLRAEHKEEST